MAEHHTDKTYLGYWRSCCWGLVIAMLLTQAACTTMSYYSQSVHGHMSIWLKRKDINKLIRNQQTPAKLRTRLQLILQIRDFASSDLNLPKNYSFRSYANIKRKHVVWNVVATPEFSFEPKKWCFPVLGCLSYKGYYAEQRTRREAERLRKLGYDVYVGGVTAYSTLGWFADPVLSTYVYWDEAALAGLIFHELAHQVIYVSGDSAFNESFATTVELEGMRRWVHKTNKPELLKQYKLAKKRERQFIAFVLKTRKKLKRLYKLKINDQQKRKRKQALIMQMKRDYKKLRKSWNGYAGYDAFMAKKINNAQLASVATYYKHVNAFKALLKKNNNDMTKFYAEVKRIGKLKPQQRAQTLKQLLKK